ncbi:CRISPR-associated endonuclease Cas3'' [Streptomyces lycii]|uniref:CRISPR-associated endonuclease Cas3 n=1 Tax=Streptomyces lycii TaxID=2654337 RepID=A0ABQ7FED6_9ACTN|nr:CRISPR-associated endonuclease Cas3'' [Streptomyces lycii]KAF4405577.1 CRISPR-associated endonuclease Cas3'' [Streptomyces lycii]
MVAQKEVDALGDPSPAPEGKLVAHSPGHDGTWHWYEDHARGTGELARRFAEPWGGGELAYRLGRDHDTGKGACAWQEGLIEEAATGRKTQRPPHNDAGAFLFARAAEPVPALLPCAGVIQGHHTGLSAWPEVRLRLKALMADSSEVDEAIHRVAAVMPEILDGSCPAAPDWLDPGDKIAVEMLVRMTFSAVVDADRLDTAAHFRSGTHIRPHVGMSELWERYESRRQEALAERQSSKGASWLDKLRENVYQEALEAAVGKPGVYRLHLPTGAGKTFTGGGFALRHASLHGLRRVIVAVPFVSITEQNAAEYRRLLDPEQGPPTVLEHHSAVNVEAPQQRTLQSAGTSKNVRPGQTPGRPNRWAKLATENWDAPFIVTTTVRLIETIFGNTPWATRRLHRLANSVIVLDEVQALPDRLLTPILSGLRELVDHYGVTLVLSSATQPELAALNPWRSGLLQRDVVSDPAPLFEQLRRVRYEWRTGPDVTLASIATEAAEHDQALVVVNGTKDASQVHRKWLSTNRGKDPGALHLSTRMTGGHRRETIQATKQRLEEGLDTLLVSTSLIEAGVNLDFPRGYRARSTPESEQQAAGRVNREGKRLAEDSVMTIFDPRDGLNPEVVYNKCAVAAAVRRFGDGLAAPDDLDALRSYYQHRYRLQAGQHSKDPSGATGEVIEALRARLHYPEVAHRMRIIDNEHSVAVVVIRQQLDEETQRVAQKAVEQLRRGLPTPVTYRTLQEHMASIPERELELAINAGHAIEVAGDLHQWVGPYHPQRGIEPPA